MWCLGIVLTLFPELGVGGASSWTSAMAWAADCTDESAAEEVERAWVMEVDNAEVVPADTGVLGPLALDPEEVFLSVILLIPKANLSNMGLDPKLLLGLGRGWLPVMKTETLSLRGVWLPPLPLLGGTPTSLVGAFIPA